MAVMRTSFGNAAAIGDAFDAAEETSVALQDTLIEGADAFLFDGTINIFFSSLTQVTGHFVGPGGLSLGSFEMRGSSLGDGSPATITYFRFDAVALAYSIELFGNVTVSETESGGSHETGFISRLKFNSAELQVDIRGNIDVQDFLYSDTVSGIKSIGVGISGANDVDVLLRGSFSLDINGEISGTVTGFTFGLDGQSLEVSGINRSYSVLNIADPEILLGTLLNGNDTIIGTGLGQELKGYGGNDVLTAGNGHDRLVGGNGNDRLLGLGGDDRLDGGSGNDTLTGGAGNDVYVVSTTGGQVIESSGGGTDTVRSSATYTLPNFVENLTLTGTADRNGTGNGISNKLTGNAGDNNLFGLGGHDTLLGGNGNDSLNGGPGHNNLNGGAGNDTLNGGAANDTLTGADGNDTLLSGAGRDTLLGGNGNDSLAGGDGGDSLVGGAGADTLLGGAGDDILIWDAADTLVNGGAGTDTLRVTGSAGLDLTALAGTTVRGIEAIDLVAGSGTNSLTLALGDVLALPDTSNTLTIDGDNDDAVTVTDGIWADGGEVGGYNIYTLGAATLRIAAGIEADITLL